MEKEQYDLGYYMPSYYFIKVNVFKNFDEEFYEEEESDKNIIALFFHEYIHYLQNISTICGFADTALSFIEVRELIDKIKVEGKQIFIPLTLEDSQLKQFSRWSKGKNSDEAKKIRVRDVKNVDIKYQKEGYVTKNGDTSYLHRIFVECHSEKEYLGKFEFGSKAIKESMAKLLQERISLPIQLSTVPYETAELLVSHIYPALLDDKLNIIAICEYSLNSEFQPGYWFVEIVEEMKREEFLPKNVDDVFKFCDQVKTAKYTNISIDKYYYNQLNAVVNLQIKEFEGCNEMTDRIQRIYDIVKSERQSNPYFLTKLVASESNDKLNLLTDKFGLPIIFNIDSEAFSDKNAGFFLMLFPRYDIRTLLLTVNRENLHGEVAEQGEIYKCSLIPFCSKTQEYEVDKNCNSTPWKRIEEKKEDCPFTATWKGWGLEHKEIVTTPHSEKL